MWKHWTCDKKFTTIGRSGHFCYTDNNNNFVVEGGLTNNNDFEYDVENDSLPENSRLSPAVCLVKGVLFLFGGSGKSQPEEKNVISDKTLFKRADRDEKWKELECKGENKPAARYGASLSASECGSFLILFGGTDGTGYFRDVWKLQLQEDFDNDDADDRLEVLEWRELTKPEHRDTIRFYQMRRNYPIPRYKHASFIKNECLFVVGGGQWVDFSNTPFENIRTAQADPLEDIHKFDFKQKTWKVVSTIPCPAKTTDEIDLVEGYPNNRLNMAWVVTSDNRFLYLVGGEQVRKTRINPGFSKRRPFNDIWRLDISTLTWKFVCYIPDDTTADRNDKYSFIYNLYNYGPMNFGTWGLTYHSCCLSVSENYLYIFGGYRDYFHGKVDPVSRDRRSVLLKFCLNTSTLYEIAENILHKHDIYENNNNIFILNDKYKNKQSLR